MLLEHSEHSEHSSWQSLLDGKPWPPQNDGSWWLLSPPGEVGELLKIDLLQPLASARLVLHPYEDLYSISFQEKGGMLLGMKSLGALDWEVDKKVEPSWRWKVAPKKLGDLWPMDT